MGQLANAAREAALRVWFRIGYEGRHIDEFVNDLVRKEVEILADVRLTPFSRKPGFSKSRLRDRLEVGVIDLRSAGSTAAICAPWAIRRTIVRHSTMADHLRPQARQAVTLDEDTWPVF